MCRPLDKVLACPFPCSLMCQQLLTSTFIFDELYKTLINDEKKNVVAHDKITCSTNKMFTSEIASYFYIQCSKCLNTVVF